MHEIGVRRPLESGSNASTIDADDLYIGSGSVDAMQSCSDATGTTLLSSGNDSNYTKVTISGATSDLTGFTITLEILTDACFTMTTALPRLVLPIRTPSSHLVVGQ